MSLLRTRLLLLCLLLLLGGGAAAQPQPEEINEETPIVEVEPAEILEEEIPGEEIPTSELTEEEIPVEEIPVEETPVEEIPVEEIPGEEIPEEIPEFPGTTTGPVCPRPLANCALTEIFNWESCACDCRDASTQECFAAQVFDEEACACACEVDIEACQMRPGSWAWDPFNCCYCDDNARYQCFEEGLLWDQENCACVPPPPPLPCDHDHTWEYQTLASPFVLPLLPPLPPIPGPGGASLCGNMVVESGEQCDANYDEFGARIAGDDEMCAGACRTNCECAECLVPGQCPQLDAGGPAPAPPARADSLLAAGRRAQRNGALLNNTATLPHLAGEEGTWLVRADGSYVLYHPAREYCAVEDFLSLDVPPGSGLSSLLLRPPLDKSDFPAARPYAILDETGKHVGGCDANGLQYTRMEGPDGVFLDYGAEGSISIPRKDGSLLTNACEPGERDNCVFSDVPAASACLVWEDRKATRKPGSSSPPPPGIAPPGALPLSDYPDAINAYLDAQKDEIEAKALRWNIIFGPPGRGSPSTASTSVGDNPFIVRAANDFMPTVIQEFDAHTKADIELCALALGGTACSTMRPGRQRTIDEISAMRRAANGLRQIMVYPVLDTGKKAVAVMYYNDIDRALAERSADPLNTSAQTGGFDANGNPIPSAPINTIGGLTGAMAQLSHANGRLDASLSAPNADARRIGQQMAANEAALGEMGDALSKAAQETAERMQGNRDLQRRVDARARAVFQGVFTSMKDLVDNHFEVYFDFIKNDPGGSQQSAERAFDMAWNLIEGVESAEFVDYVAQHEARVNVLVAQLETDKTDLASALARLQNNINSINNVPVTEEPARTVWRLAIAMEAAQIVTRIEASLLTMQHSYLEAANTWYAVNKTYAAAATDLVRATAPSNLCQLPGAGNGGAVFEGDGDDPTPPGAEQGPQPPTTGSDSSQAGGAAATAGPPADPPVVPGINDEREDLPDREAEFDEQHRADAAAERAAQLAEMDAVNDEYRDMLARFGLTIGEDGATLLDGEEVFILPVPVLDDNGNIRVPAGTILPVSGNCQQIRAQIDGLLSQGVMPDEVLLTNYQVCQTFNAAVHLGESRGVITGPNGEAYNDYMNALKRRSDEALATLEDNIAWTMLDAGYLPAPGDDESVWVGPFNHEVTVRPAADGTLRVIEGRYDDQGQFQGSGNLLVFQGADLVPVADLSPEEKLALIEQRDLGPYEGWLRATAEVAILANTLSQPQEGSLQEQRQAIARDLKRFKERAWGARVGNDTSAAAVYDRATVALARVLQQIDRALALEAYWGALDQLDPQRMAQAVEDLGGFSVADLRAALTPQQRAAFTETGELPDGVVETLLRNSLADIESGLAFNADNPQAFGHRATLLRGLLARLETVDFVSVTEASFERLRYEQTATLQAYVDRIRKVLETGGTPSDRERILANGAANELARLEMLSEDDRAALRGLQQGAAQIADFAELLGDSRERFRAAERLEQERVNIRSIATELSGIVADVMGVVTRERAALQARLVRETETLQGLLIRSRACEPGTAGCDELERQVREQQVLVTGLEAQLANQTRSITADQVREIRDRLQLLAEQRPDLAGAYNRFISNLEYFEGLLRSVPLLRGEEVSKTFFGYTYTSWHLSTYIRQAAEAGSQLYSNPAAFYNDTAVGSLARAPLETALSLEGLQIQRRMMDAMGQDLRAIDAEIARLDGLLKKHIADLSGQLTTLNTEYANTSDAEARVDLERDMAAVAAALARLQVARDKVQRSLAHGNWVADREVRRLLPPDVVTADDSGGEFVRTAQGTRGRIYDLPRGNIERSFQNLRQLGVTTGGDRVFLVVEPEDPDSRRTGFEGRIITIKRDERVLLSHRSYQLDAADGLGDVIDRLNRQGSGEIHVVGTSITVGDVLRELEPGVLESSPLGMILVHTGAADQVSSDNDTLTIEDGPSSGRNAFPWFTNSIRDAERAFRRAGGNVNSLSQAQRANLELTLEGLREKRLALYGLADLPPAVLQRLMPELTALEKTASALVRAMETDLVSAANMHSGNIQAAADAALRGGNLADNFSLLGDLQEFMARTAGLMRQRADQYQSELNFDRAHQMRERQQEMFQTALRLGQARREHAERIAGGLFDFYLNSDGNVDVSPAVESLYDADNRRLFAELTAQLDSLANARDPERAAQQRALILTRLRTVLRTTADVDLTLQVVVRLVREDRDLGSPGMLVTDLSAAVEKIARSLALVEAAIGRRERELQAATGAGERQAIERALTALRAERGRYQGHMTDLLGTLGGDREAGMIAIAIYRLEHGQPVLPFLAAIPDAALRDRVMARVATLMAALVENDRRRVNAAQHDALRRNGRYNTQTRFDGATRDLAPGSNPLFFVAVSEFIMGEGGRELQDAYAYVTGGETWEQEFYGKQNDLYRQQGAQRDALIKLRGLGLMGQHDLVTRLLSGSDTVEQLAQEFDDFSEAELDALKKYQQDTRGNLGYRYGVLGARNTAEVQEARIRNLVPSQIDFMRDYLGNSVAMESGESQFAVPNITSYRPLDFTIHTTLSVFSSFSKLRAAYKVLSEDQGGQVRAYILNNLGTQRVGANVLAGILSRKSQLLRAAETRVDGLVQQLDDSNLTAAQRQQLQDQLRDARRARDAVRDTGLNRLAAMSKTELENFLSWDLDDREFQSLAHLFESNPEILSMRAQEAYGEGKLPEFRRLAAASLRVQYDVALLAHDYDGAIALAAQITQFDPEQANLREEARALRNEQFWDRQLDVSFRVLDNIAGQAAIGRFAGLIGRSASGVMGERLLTSLGGSTNRFAVLFTRLQLGTTRLGLRFRQGLRGFADDVVAEAWASGVPRRLIRQMSAQRQALRRAIDAYEDAIRLGKGSRAADALRRAQAAQRELTRLARQGRAAITGPQPGLFGLGGFFGPEARSQVIRGLTFYVNPKEVLDEMVDEAGGELFEFLKLSGSNARVAIRGAFSAHIQATADFRQQADARFAALMANLQLDNIRDVTAFDGDARVYDAVIDTANRQIRLLDADGNVVRVIDTLEEAAALNLRNERGNPLQFAMDLREALSELQTENMTDFLENLRAQATDPLERQRIDATINQIQQLGVAKMANLRAAYQFARAAQAVQNAALAFSLNTRYTLPLPSGLGYLQARVSGQTAQGAPRFSYQTFDRQGRPQPQLAQTAAGVSLDQDQLFDLVNNAIGQGLVAADALLDADGRLRVDGPLDGVVMNDPNVDMDALVADARAALDQLTQTGLALDSLRDGNTLAQQIAAQRASLHAAQRHFQRYRSFPASMTDPNASRAMDAAVLQQSLAIEALRAQLLRQTQGEQQIDVFGRSFRLGETLRYQGELAQVTALVDGVGIVITTTLGGKDIRLDSSSQFDQVQQIPFDPAWNLSVGEQVSLLTFSDTAGVSVASLMAANQAVQDNLAATLAGTLQAANADAAATTRELDPCASPCSKLAAEFEAALADAVAALREAQVPLPAALDVAEIGRQFAAGNWLAVQQLFDPANAFPELAATAAEVLDNLFQDLRQRHADITNMADFAARFPNAAMTFHYLRAQQALAQGDIDGRVNHLGAALTLADLTQSGDQELFLDQWLAAQAQQLGLDQTVVTPALRGELGALRDRLGVNDPSVAQAASQAFQNLAPGILTDGTPMLLLETLEEIDGAPLAAVRDYLAQPSLRQAITADVNLLPNLASHLAVDGTRSAAILAQFTNINAAQQADLVEALGDPQVRETLADIIQTHPARYQEMGGADAMIVAVHRLAELRRTGQAQTLGHALNIMEGFTKATRRLSELFWSDINMAAVRLPGRAYAIYMRAVSEMLYLANGELRPGLIDAAGPYATSSFRAVVGSDNAFNEAFEVVATLWLVQSGQQIQIQHGVMRDETPPHSARTAIPRFDLDSVLAFGWRYQRRLLDPADPNAARSTLEADTLIEVIDQTGPQPLAQEVIIDWKRYMDAARRMKDSDLNKAEQLMRNPTLRDRNVIFVAPGPWNQVYLAPESGLMLGHIQPDGVLEEFLNLSL